MLEFLMQHDKPILLDITEHWEVFPAQWEE